MRFGHPPEKEDKGNNWAGLSDPKSMNESSIVKPVVKFFEGNSRSNWKPFMNIFLQDFWVAGGFELGK